MTYKGNPAAEGIAAARAENGMREFEAILGFRSGELPLLNDTVTYQESDREDVERLALLWKYIWLCGELEIEGDENIENEASYLERKLSVQNFDLRPTREKGGVR